MLVPLFPSCCTMSLRSDVPKRFKWAVRAAFVLNTLSPSKLKSSKRSPATQVQPSQAEPRDCKRKRAREDAAELATGESRFHSGRALELGFWQALRSHATTHATQLLCVFEVILDACEQKEYWLVTLTVRKIPK